MVARSGPGVLGGLGHCLGITRLRPRLDSGENFWASQVEDLHPSRRCDPEGLAGAACTSAIDGPAENEFCGLVQVRSEHLADVACV